MKCTIMQLKKFCHGIVSMHDRTLQGNFFFFFSFLAFCYILLQDLF